MTVPRTGWLEKFKTVTCVTPLSSRCTMTSIALSDTGGTSSWVLVAMPYRARTAKMSRSRETNEFASSSCSGSDPYRLTARGTFDSRLGDIGLVIHQVVGPAIDPAGVTSRQQPWHLGWLEGEQPAQVPAGKSEYTWLKRVEHGQQQVPLLDLLDQLPVQVRKVRDAERRSDDRRGGGGNAVGGEGGVVRTRITSEPLNKLAADCDGELRTRQVGTAESESIVSCAQPAKCTSS